MCDETAESLANQSLSLLMCKPEDLKHQAQWDGAAGVSRTHLLSELSSGFELPRSVEAVLTSNQNQSPQVP